MSGILTLDAIAQQKLKGSEKMSLEIKTIFFDIDDTLFDRERAQHEIIRLFLYKYVDLFKGLDADLVEDAFIRSDQISIETCNPNDSVEQFRLARTKIFLDLVSLDYKYSETLTNDYVQLYPKVNVPTVGANDTVKKLSKRHRLGIISNGFTDVQYEKLRTLNLLHFFNPIVLSEEVGIEKPNTRIFQKACDLIPIDPEYCLYIGDSFENDVVGSKNAGMLSCWYNHNSEQLKDSAVKPDFTIDSLEKLLSAVFDQ